MDFLLNFQDIISIFVVLFALIDVLGSVPIFLGIQQSDKNINPLSSSIYAFLIMAGFLFVGEGILKLFNVDLSAFAVAGAVVILIISIEMIFGIEVFKNDSPSQSSSFVPVVFPLIAGPATFTAMLSMRADYGALNIIIALFANIVFVYIVLSNLKRIQRIIGAQGIYIMRKFFGIILLAISVKLITSNFSALWQSIQGASL